jgi:hypothetical protein
MGCARDFLLVLRVDAFDCTMEQVRLLKGIL